MTDEIPVSSEERQRLRQLGVSLDMTMYLYLMYRFPRGESTVIHDPKTLYRADDWDRVTDKGGYTHEIPTEKCHHLKMKKRDGAKSEVIFEPKHVITEESEKR